MARGRGPSAESLRDQYDHSYEHRGESGMFGSYFAKDVDEWSPADGENEVAIVPYVLTDNSIFRKKNPDLNRPVKEALLKSGEGWVHKLSVFVHGNIGPNKDRVVCLKTIKERCPVCDLREQLRKELAELKTRGRTDQELEERIGQLGASKRAIYNIVSFNSRKDKERGLVVWAAPHASIEDVVVDRARDKRSGEYKSFAVLQENWNIFFRKTGKGLSTEYSEVDVLDRRKEDCFSDDEADRLLQEARVLDEIVEVKTYEQLYEMLHGSPPQEARSTAGDQNEEPERPRSKRGEPADESREERPRDREERSAKPSRSEGEAKGLSSDRPECFAVEFNQIADCEDCASEIFKACMKASDEAVRSGGGRADRGSEDRASGRGGREGRASRSSRS